MSRPTGPLLVQDPDRLAALESYAILDTAPEPGFDDVVVLAAQACDVPVALVSLVDRDRQWFKARVGFPPCETDLNSSVCKFVLAEPDILQIPDLTADPRTAANPLVTGAPHIRFYAGAPLRAADGQVLGSLCVIDKVPRPEGLTELQADALRRFARQTMALLELRQAVAERDRKLDRQDAELRRERRLEVLADLSSKLLNASQPAQVLETVLATEADSLKVDRSYIYEVIPGQDALRLTHGIGIGERTRALLQHMPFGSPVCGLVAQGRKPVIFSDLQAGTDPCFQAARDDGVNAYAGYPIVSRGQLRGVVAFGSLRTHAFDPETLAFFTTVARFLSLAQERLDSDAALRDAERRARQAQEAGQVGTFEVDVTSGMMQVSAEYCRLYGVPVAPVYSTGVFENLVLPEDADQRSSDETREAGTAPLDVEYRIRRADTHELRWIARRATFVRDATGRVISMFGAIRDVTDQRTAQAALQTSESRFRALATAGAQSLYRMSPDWQELRQLDGAGFLASTQTPDDQWLASYIDPDDRPAVLSAIKSAIARKTTFELEHRVRRSDGSVGWTLSRAVPILDARGEIVEWFGAATDVTDRREAEEALRRSEERFRTILDTVDAAFAIVEVKFDGDDRPVDYRFVEANPAFERQAGVNLRGKWVTEFAPDLERFWFETYGHVARTGEPATFESYAEAFERWFDVRAVRVGAAEERRIAILFTDSTARKQAEVDLRASEALARENVERVQLALAAGAIIGTWNWDISNDRFTVDGAFATAFGLDPALGSEGIPLAQIVATVHPDDQAGLAMAISDAIARGGAYAHQYRVRRADGHYYWIEANGRVDRGPDGTPQSFPGVLLDIEERRAAEVRRGALLALGDRLRDQTDITAMTLAACDILGTTLGVELVGYGNVDAHHETITVERDWTTGGAKTLAGTLNFRDFGTYIEDLKRNETVVVTDCLSDPRASAYAAALEEKSARAFVNTPVFERGVFMALLYVSTVRARTWTDPELAFIREVASRLRSAVARVEAEQQRALLNHELSHRMKNILAMVQAIATQTLRNTSDPDAAREALAARLVALGKAHDILMSGQGQSADMRLVILDALKIHDDGRPGRFQIVGPAVTCGSKAALSLALMIHELATNAAKYGALRVPAGTVAISWAPQGEPGQETLTLRWRENGGPTVTTPTRKGFGSRLIERGLAGSVGGTVMIEYPPEGVTCTLVAPLSGFADQS